MAHGRALVLLAVLLAAVGCQRMAPQSTPPGAADGLPRWLDARDLGRSGFGTLSLQLHGGQSVAVYSYRATRFAPATGPILFVMHGVSRNAEDYLRAVAPLAERHDALALAIQFDDRAYPRPRDYTLGVTRTGPPDGSAWMQARWRQPEDYLYAEIEHAFDLLRATLGGRQSGYYLLGHSAGAQFTHRLLTLLPQPRVLAAVAANAGWYTLPVAKPGPSYRFPYGLQGTPLSEADIADVLQRPLTVLLGERDRRRDKNLRTTTAAMAQGADRYERGLYYFARATEAAADLGVPLRWRLATVPHGRHRFADMVPSAGFYLFTADAQPCRPDIADSIGIDSLRLAGVLVAPARRARGDSNGDGARHAGEDEWVRIANTGPRSLCLSGWTLGDAAGAVRHVFPDSGGLPSGRSIIVFGGGVPTGTFDGQVQWASRGTGLDLSDGGDVLTLRDAGGATVRQISWGDCAGAACAVEHYPAPRRGAVLPTH